MAVVTMRQLLESGVHFGHQTRRWNPKMKRFIFTERNGIYIIDLQQSLSYIDRAYEFVRETVAHGGTILFVGTKKQAQEAIVEQATRVGMPYVNRALARRHAHQLLHRAQAPAAPQGARGDRLRRRRRLRDAPRRSCSSCAARRTSWRRPSAASATWAGCPAPSGSSTPRRSTSPSTRPSKLGIPVVAILDTNCDPDEVDYKIPGNDDAIRSVHLLTRVVADAVAEGLMARAGAPVRRRPTAEVGGGEPLAEWERELLGEAAAESVAEAVAAEAVAESRWPRPSWPRPWLRRPWPRPSSPRPWPRRRWQRPPGPSRPDRPRRTHVLAPPSTTPNDPVRR